MLRVHTPWPRGLNPHVWTLRFYWKHLLSPRFTLPRNGFHSLKSEENPRSCSTSDILKTNCNAIVGADLKGLIRRQLKESPHPLQEADTKDWQIPWPKWRDTVLYTTFALTLKHCRGPMNRRKPNKSRFFPWLITRRPLVTSHLAKVHHRQSVIVSKDRTSPLPAGCGFNTRYRRVSDRCFCSCLCLSTHGPRHGSRE